MAGSWIKFILKLPFKINTGETDWKILAIDVTDPLAEKING